MDIVKVKRILEVTRIPCLCRRFWWSLVTVRVVAARGVRIGEGVRLYGSPLVSLAPMSTIELGPRVVLCSDSRYTALGVTRPVILRTLRHRARIIVGADTGMSGTAVCAAISVEIGKEVLAGPNVVIADTDFHPLNPKCRRFNNSAEDIAARPVSIGDNVFIGAGATILKGARIGKDSVIGAGSVVLGEIPPGVIAAGNPARVIRDIG